MSDAYAPIAEGYRKSKLQPWRKHIEEFTLFELLGDVTGKSVLDLACGEGFYTRRLRRRGAARVVGLDVSERMIALARAEEGRQRLDIRYVRQDVMTWEASEHFDVVVAAYLLNYARTPEELAAMARAVARSLAPGGRFVAVNNHLGQPVEAYGATAKYGLVKRLDGALRDGAAIRYTLFTNGAPVEFDNYYLSPQTYEDVLRSAGLRQVRWHAPRLAPAGAAEFGRAFWDAFLQRPPIYFLECTRPS